MPPVNKAKPRVF